MGLFKHAASVAAIILNGCDNECALNTKELQRILYESYLPTWSEKLAEMVKECVRKEEG